MPTLRHRVTGIARLSVSGGGSERGSHFRAGSVGLDASPLFDADLRTWLGAWLLYSIALMVYLIWRADRVLRTIALVGPPRFARNSSSSTWRSSPACGACSCSCAWAFCTSALEVCTGALCLIHDCLRGRP